MNKDCEGERRTESKDRIPGNGTYWAVAHHLCIVAVVMANCVLGALVTR